MKSTQHCRVVKCLGVKDNEHYVVKIIKKECIERDGDDYDYHLGEIELKETIGDILDSSLLNFEYISEVDDQVFLIVSKYRGITLSNYRPISLTRKLLLCEVLQLMVRVVNALGLLHKNQIIHNDIKPDNIFIWEFPIGDYSIPALSVVLGDFGTCKKVIENEETDGDLSDQEELTGTVGYLPPEGFSSKEGDIWSLGRSMLTMLFPKKLHPDEVPKYLDCITNLILNMNDNDNSIVELIEMGDLEEFVNGWRKFFQLLKSMLNSDPKERPSCMQILKSIFPNTSNELQGLISLANQFEFLDHSFHNHNMQLLAAVSGVGIELLDKSNREIVFQSLKYCATMDNVSDYLKDSPFNTDREMVLMALRLNESAIKYVDKSLLRDRDFILELVSKCGWCFRYIHGIWGSDRQVVLNAVKSSGYSLEHAHESLKRDPQIVLTAIHQNIGAFKYADESFKNDRKFVLNAVQKNGNALAFASYELLNDRELVKVAVTQDGCSLSFLSNTFKEDREIVKLAVQQYGHSLRYAAKALRKDIEIVKLAIQENGSALIHADELLRENVELMDFAEHSRKQQKVLGKVSIRNHCERPFALVNTPISANKRDRHIVLLAVEENGLSLEFADEIFKKDREIVMKAVQQNGIALKFADEIFKKDRDLVLAAIKRNEKAFESVDKSLKLDKDFILQAVELRGFVIDFVDDSFKKDREVVMKSLLQEQQAVYIFAFSLEDSMRDDREIVLFAVSINGFVLQHVSEFFKRDREVVLRAVQKHGCALEYADESLKKDSEIVSEAVKQDSSAIQFSLLQ